MNRIRGQKSEEKSLQFVRTIPDVVWGEIPLTQLELNIIRLPLFSRLLEVKQMGVASVSFLGAIHQRYQHCLGVMHVADRLLSLFQYQLPGKKDRFFLENHPNIQTPERQALRIAGLLHDIGHPPLSHVIEEAFRKSPEIYTDIPEESRSPFVRELFRKNYYSHENASRYQIENNEDLAGELSRAGYSPDDIKQIALLAVGEATRKPYSLLNELISGDLDADKIDYIKRDGHYCGFLSAYDLPDFRGALFLEETAGDEQVKPNAFVDASALSTVNAFLMARYREIEDIHFDEKARIASQIVIRDFIASFKAMGVKDRHRKIEKLHLQARDSDLVEYMNSREQQMRLDGVRRGILDEYREVFITGRDREIEFEALDPVERMCLHVILEFPPAIVSLEKKISSLVPEHIGLIVDLRTAKPPKFLLKVKYGGEYSQAIFTKSNISKGILRDSICHLKLHFYAKGVQGPIELDFQQVKKFIIESAVWALNQQFNQGIVPGILCLVGICSIAQQDFDGQPIDHPTEDKPIPWVYSETQLRKFVVSVLDESKIVSPYKYSEQDDSADAGFVRDLEIAIALGVLQERTVNIEKPAANGDLLWISRRDFRVPAAGLSLFRSIIEIPNAKKYFEAIDGVIKKRQLRNDTKLREYFKSEYVKFRFAGGKSGEISQKRVQLRKGMGSALWFVP